MFAISSLLLLAIALLASGCVIFSKGRYFLGLIAMIAMFIPLGTGIALLAKL